MQHLQPSAHREPAQGRWLSCTARNPADARSRKASLAPHRQTSHRSCSGLDMPQDIVAHVAERVAPRRAVRQAAGRQRRAPAIEMPQNTCCASQRSSTEPRSALGHHQADHTEHRLKFTSSSRTRPRNICRCSTARLSGRGAAAELARTLRHDGRETLSRGMRHRLAWDARRAGSDERAHPK